jgi:hypothetical protein
MGRMVNLRGWWWLSELAVGVQVRGGTCALTTRIALSARIARMSKREAHFRRAALKQSASPLDLGLDHRIPLLTVGDRVSMAPGCWLAAGRDRRARVEAAIPWRQRAYLGADGANLLIMDRRGQDRERLRTWQHRPASQTLRRTYNRLGIEERYSLFNTRTHRLDELPQFAKWHPVFSWHK